MPQFIFDITPVQKDEGEVVISIFDEADWKYKIPLKAGFHIYSMGICLITKGFVK